MTPYVQTKPHSLLAGRGHASANLRQVFLNAIDAFERWPENGPEPTVLLDGINVSISRVCNLLRNCSDVLPGPACRQIRELALWHYGDPLTLKVNGVSYASGARLLKDMVSSIQKRFDKGC